jgi:hypothetical protein
MHFKNFEYLREFEFIFEKALAPYQEPRTDVLMKKTKGRKSRDTVPLTAHVVYTLFNASFLQNCVECFRKAEDSELTSQDAKPCVQPVVCPTFYNKCWG